MSNNTVQIENGLQSQFNKSDQNKNGLSIFSASAFIVGAVAGAGMLSLPFAVAGTGMNMFARS